MIRKYKYLKSVIKEKLAYLRTLNQVSGVGLNEYLNLKYNKFKGQATLFNHPIQVTDAFWHLHSLNELFVEAIYNFKSSKENPTIIDCGSNVGLSSIYFKKLYPKAHVLSFEADPSIFQMMVNNFSVFGYTDIIAINKAVWKENTTLKFNANGALGGAIDSSYNTDYLNSDSLVISAVRLKDILQGFSEIDFLKIDIEGAEIEVLEDCKEVLGNINYLFVEFHRRKGQNISVYKSIEVLETAGFRIYIKEAWNNLPKPFLYNEYNPHFDLQLNIFAVRIK